MTDCDRCEGRGRIPGFLGLWTKPCPECEGTGEAEDESAPGPAGSSPDEPSDASTAAASGDTRPSEETGAELKDDGGLMEPGSEAQMWYDRAYQAISEGPDVEIEYYKKALELCPDYYDAWYGLSKAYGQIGKVRERMRCEDELARIVEAQSKMKREGVAAEGTFFAQGAHWYYRVPVPLSESSAVAIQDQVQPTHYHSSAMELWRYPEEESTSVDADQTFRCLAATPEGKLVAVTEEGLFTDFPDGEISHAGDEIRYRNAVASPDASRVVLFQTDEEKSYMTRRLLVVGMEGQEPRVVPDTERAEHCAWIHGTDRLLVTFATIPNQLRLIDVNTGECLVKKTLDFEVVGIASALKVGVVAVGGTKNSCIQVYDVADGELNLRWERETPVPGPLLLNERGDRLLCNFDKNGIQLWDAHGGEQIETLDRLEKGPHMAFSPDSKSVLVGDYEAFFIEKAETIFKE